MKARLLFSLAAVSMVASPVMAATPAAPAKAVKTVKHSKKHGIAAAASTSTKTK
jgi:Ni/Co efflux regulator RcnB